MLRCESSSLYGTFRGVGRPGALDTAAIFWICGVDIDFDIGRGCGTTGLVVFAEENDRRCCKERWADERWEEGQTATCAKLR